MATTPTEHLLSLPGIIVTPLELDEFNGPCGDFYKNMFTNCPADRPGTSGEVTVWPSCSSAAAALSSPARTFWWTARPPLYFLRTAQNIITSIKTGGNTMDYVTLNNGVRMPQLGYGVYRWPRLKPNGAWPTLSAWATAPSTPPGLRQRAWRGRRLAQDGVSRDSCSSPPRYGSPTPARKGCCFHRRLPASPSRPIMWTCCSSTSPLGITTVPIWRWKGLPRRQGPRDRREQFLPRPLYRPSTTFAEVTPAVNQVETHVFQQQKVAREVLAKHHTQIESWGPFAEGRNQMFTNPRPDRDRRQIRQKP